MATGADSGFGATLGRLLRHGLWRWLRLLALWLLLALCLASLKPGLDHALGRLDPPRPPQGYRLPLDEVPPRQDPTPDCPAPAAQPAQPAWQRPAELAWRDIRLDLRGGRASLSLEAGLDPCSPRWAQLNQVLGAGAPLPEPGRQALREALFGYLDLGGRRFSSGVPRRLDADARGPLRLHEEASLELDAELLAEGALVLEYIPTRWYADSTRLTVLSDPGTAIWPAELAPLRQEEGRSEWLLTERLAGLRLTIYPARPPASRAAAAPPREEPLLLRALQQRVGLLQPLGLWLGWAVPFALLLVWGRRAAAVQATPQLRALQAGCRAALLLIALLAMMETAERLAYLDLPLAAALGLQAPGWSAQLAKLSMLGLVWPLLLARDRDAAGRGLALALPALLCLAAAALCVLFLPGTPRLDALAYMRPGPEGQDQRLLLFALLGLALALAALALGAELARGWRVPALALLLPLGAALASGVEFGRRWEPHVGALIPLLALSLGLGFGHASRLWQLGAALPRGAWLLAGALLAGLLALPPDPDQRWLNSWLLSSSAWVLVRLWQLPALALLLTWLAQQGRGPAAQCPPAPTRLAGALLLFIVVFWSPQQPWLPMLAQAGLGVLMLRYWVFAPRVPRAPGPRRLHLLQQGLLDMGAHNRLLDLRRPYAKALAEKLGRGELGPAELERRREDLERQLARREPAAARGRCRAMLALNAGGRGDAWTRGGRGALGAGLLALPWVLTFLAHSGIARAGSHAELVAGLQALLLELAVWPVLGFFFLYFYPLLRGNNGIQKGLCLSLALLLPPLGAALANGDLAAAETWQGLLFWWLQVFICCMSLGVGLGDIGALRQAGKGPASLLEIYRLGTLAAWSSSLALAVGAAASTALAGQVGSLFAAGLKLLLPAMPAATGH